MCHTLAVSLLMYQTDGKQLNYGEKRHLWLSIWIINLHWI